MNSGRNKLLVVRGVVTGAREQIQSVCLDRQTYNGRIRTTPELWLCDENGKEHRYEGKLFGRARPGHDVAVISRPGSNRALAFANFTTELVYDGDELTINTSVGSNLISTLGFSLLLALPGALVWITLLNTIGLASHAFTAAGLQIYVLVLIASVYAGLVFWSRRYRERTSALRKEIDCLLEIEAARSTRKERKP